MLAAHSKPFPALLSRIAASRFEPIHRLWHRAEDAVKTLYMRGKYRQVPESFIILNQPARETI